MRVRYSIHQLLKLRIHASQPKGIEEVVKLVCSSLVNRNRGARRHKGKPPLIATKMPLKTSKSEVLMLLNKLGGDQIADIGEQIYTIYTKSDEKDELVTWIHTKTFAQRDLADLFAEMWSCIFRRDRANDYIRKLHLTLSAQRFRGLVFEDTETSEEAILNVCEAMTAFKTAQLIDLRPITEIVNTLVTQMRKDQCAKGCAKGLDVVKRGLSVTQLNSLVAQTTTKMSKEQCLKYFDFLFMSTTPTDAYCTTVFPMLLSLTAANLPGPNVDEKIREIFMNKTQPPPRQDQVALLLTLQKHSLEHELAAHLISLLHREPTVIEAVLVIFRLRRKNIPAPLIALMHQSADDYISSATSTPRLKFKYMDFKDLKL